MKNAKVISQITLLIIAFSAVFILSNFQKKPVEYQIVDGFLQYWPKETSTYYVWDGSRSVEVTDRNDMIRIMQQFGFDLVSTHSSTAGNSGGYPRYKETWIFKK